MSTGCVLREGEAPSPRVIERMSRGS